MWTRTFLSAWKQVLTQRCAKRARKTAVGSFMAKTRLDGPPLDYKVNDGRFLCIVYTYLRCFSYLISKFCLAKGYTKSSNQMLSPVG